MSLLVLILERRAPISSAESTEVFPFLTLCRGDFLTVDTISAAVPTCYPTGHCSTISCRRGIQLRPGEAIEYVLTDTSSDIPSDRAPRIVPAKTGLGQFSEHPSFPLRT